MDIAVSSRHTEPSIDLSIVIPVYNNIKTLDLLREQLVQVIDGLDLTTEVIFVNDGSTDNSLEKLESYRLSDPRIRVIALTRNFGGQAALCAGFDAVRGDRTLCMDADLENLPEDIPALLAPLDDNFDLVCGVRIDRKGSLIRRRLPSKILNRYVRQHIAHSVQDVGCGMRAMDSRLIKNLERDGERRRMLSPLLLSRARSVAEVPIQHGETLVPGGHSFLSLAAIAVDFYMVTSSRIFIVCGTVAIAAFFIATAVLTAAILQQNAVVGLFGLVSLIGAALLGVLSLVGSYIQRMYHLVQNRPFYEVRAIDGRDLRLRGVPSDD